MRNLMRDIAMLSASALSLFSLLLVWLGGVALAFSTPSFNSVSASVVVPSSCGVGLDNTIINFGSIIPGSNAPTSNSVVDTNIGNVQANVLLSGNDWAFSTNSFAVGNTVWDFSLHSGGIKGNSLTSSPVDTFSQIAETAKVALYFGTNVPVQQAPGSYSQTISIENNC